MLLVSRIHVVVEVIDHLRKLLLGLFVQVGHGDSGSQNGVVGMQSGHVGGGLGSQVVELDGADSLVDSGGNLEGDLDGIHVVGIKAVTQPLDTSSDFVDLD